MPADPWPVVARQHARLIRPFPLRRLHDALHHVSEESCQIDKEVTRLLIDPPATADSWRFELAALDTALRSLRARCGDALPVLEEMARTADADYRRALDAVVAIIRGIGQEEETPSEVAA